MGDIVLIGPHHYQKEVCASLCQHAWVLYDRMLQFWKNVHHQLCKQSAFEGIGGEICILFAYPCVSVVSSLVKFIVCYCKFALCLCVLKCSICVFYCVILCLIFL